MVFDFLWTGQGTFLVQDFHRPNGAKILRFGNFPHPGHVWGVWKIAKNQSHLVKFGCVSGGILVNFLAGQENHPTFNIYGQL